MSLKSVLLCFCSDSPSEIWLIRQFSHIQVLCWNAVIHRNVTFESFKLINHIKLDKPFFRLRIFTYIHIISQSLKLCEDWS